ncbi:MAG: autotransporter assembly complex protein TamA, partial [Candidatus Binatia bacterium]
KNLARFYQARGYYEAQVSHDLEVTDEQVAAHIVVHEGEPTKVTQITFTITDQPALISALEALRSALPLREGMIFVEETYQLTEEKIQEFFFAQQRGRVQIQRKAEVVVDQHAAHVSYTVEVGPPTVFGETQVEGTVKVAPYLVSRELTYKPGDPFLNKALTTSRKNLLKLDLFNSVQLLREESPADPSIIPMRAKVDEKPPREFKFGIGYGTEDQLRGQVRWRHNNWFGDGRQFHIGVKLSAIVRELEINFVQPHFLSPKNRFSLTLTPQQLDEPGYFLNSTRVQPRFERTFTETITGFIAYRLEYDKLNDVSPATIRALQGGEEQETPPPGLLDLLFPPPPPPPNKFDREGVLSGLSLGLLWDGTDDPLNPTRGGITSFTAEQVGGALGGDFDFYKVQGEGKAYHLLTERIVLALRLKLGFADPFNGSRSEVPLFERFYAGGSNSVRGYERYRLGPLSESDDPFGGRSLIEGALEVRRQFTEKIGGALFLDFGQVSTRSFDVPIDDLEYATGFGVRYTTPAGPLRLDLGFPFDPPPGDQSWQVHFSIGQFF